MFRHLLATNHSTKKRFPTVTLKKIEEYIAASEIHHNGQIRFIVETALSPLALYQGISVKERALEIFSVFRVWDTANNNGVLIYLLMADHAFEIIADRNIHERAGQNYWDKVSHEMSILLQNNQFEEGVLFGIERITSVLKEHFPESVITPNELPDQPLII
jgi:uncharacterized membrane protein